MRLTDALGHLDEEWANQPVSLSELRYAAPTLTLKGAAAGAAARASIEPVLRKTGFEVMSVDWTASGAGGGFTAMARLGHGPTESHAAANGIFDDRSPAQLCAANSSPVSVSAHGTGNLTLQ